ncbi:hypothetical protein [Pseudomonas amygdali]|uniref:hypothetical protein n=1 Tax=Pseudomonas amygdali TaxID=47877 RepID=UPI000E3B79B7|nr:hypothetical protein [Pseudomonas amygdali]
MSTFIERNPKERVVEEAFRILAENGYISTRPDPADNIFEVAEKLRLRAQFSREEDQPSEKQ